MSTSSLTSAPFLSLAFSLSRLLYLSLFRREPGQWQRDATKRNPFARNEVRSSKTEVKLRFQGVRRNPFARNEVWSSKTKEKLQFQVSAANPFARNEVRSSKTEETLQFQVSAANPFARNEVDPSKTEVKLRFQGVHRKSTNLLHSRHKRVHSDGV